MISGRKPEIRAALQIRDSAADDLSAIESLYPEAFPDEDLVPLVRALLHPSVDAVSLLAIMDSDPVGHIVFTPCGVTGSSAKVALLGPLAVVPPWQRRGIGSALVRVGLERLCATRDRAVYVLGDPAYYARLGFAAEHSVTPPYELPEEWAGAWQARMLEEDGGAPRGRLDVPAPWRVRELWLP